MVRRALSSCAPNTIYVSTFWGFVIIFSEDAQRQAWANLDQTPYDLYTTLFRDLSATPFTQI